MNDLSRARRDWRHFAACRALLRSFIIIQKITPKDRKCHICPKSMIFANMYTRTNDLLMTATKSFSRVRTQIVSVFSWQCIYIILISTVLDQRRLSLIGDKKKNIRSTTRQHNYPKINVFPDPINIIIRVI